MAREKRDCQCKRARHQHGTRTAYVVDKCGCDPCMEANRAHNRAYNRARAYGRYDSGRVDAAPVRDHLMVLREAGIGLKRVAVLTGVSTGTLGKIVYGVPSRGIKPRARVEASVRNRILAIKPTLDAVAAGGRVDDTGTVRRLQALVAIGWSQSRLAAKIGVTPSNFGKLMVGGEVTADKARKVRAVYEELWDQPQTGTDWHSKTSATRARNMAKANGWHPPMAWDDDTIDDPATLPALEDDTTKAEARIDDIEFLVDTRTPLTEIITRSGFRTMHALERHCYRYGRGDLVARIKNSGERSAA